MTTQDYRTDIPDAQLVQEINVSLGILADRILSQRGGVILTVLILPDLSANFIQTRSTNTHNIKVSEFVRAAGNECERALQRLYVALAKEAHLK